MFGVLMLEQSWPFGENGTRFPSRLALALIRYRRVLTMFLEPAIEERSQADETR
jgi:hypothetical protein